MTTSDNPDLYDFDEEVPLDDLMAARAEMQARGMSAEDLDEMYPIPTAPKAKGKTLAQALEQTARRFTR